MKVLLIAPPQNISEKILRAYPPMSLLYLAANIKKNGDNVNILDLGIKRFYNVDLETVVLEKIENEKPDLIGFTCLISSLFPFIVRYSKLIKVKYPNIKIVIGGLHPTLFPQEILENCKEIDFVIMGEGEKSFVELCKKIKNKDEDRIVNGVAQKKENERIVIPPFMEYIKEIDELPMPAWEEIDIDEYKYDYSTWYNPKKHKIDIVAPILTSRSCPFNCNFCAFHSVMGRGFRYHSAKRVVDEIERLNKEYKINYFEFIDDNIGIKKDRLIEICKEIVIRKLDIQFTMLSGMHISTIDEEVVDALINAGYLHAILPVEHASDYIRNKIIGKNLSKEKIIEVAKLFKAKGIMTRGFFIIGFPEETEETIKETIEMIEEIDLDLVNVFNLIPFPGTRLFEQCIEEKLLLKDVDLSKMWQGDVSLETTDNKQFYIKPYNLDLEKLEYYRDKIDRIIFDKNKKAQEKWKN